VVYADENVWLTQKMMGQLYDVETHTINYHPKKAFPDRELQEDSVIRNFRITAADAKNTMSQRLLQLATKFIRNVRYNFVNGVTTIIQEYTIKG